MRTYFIVYLMAFAAIYIVSALTVWIAKLFKKKLSLYKVFGIIDVIFGLAIVIMFIVDIVTPGGDLNGLVGTILLMVFEPAVILFLVVDILLYRAWLKRDTYSESKGELTDESGMV